MCVTSHMGPITSRTDPRLVRGIPQRIPQRIPPRDPTKNQQRIGGIHGDLESSHNFNIISELNVILAIQWREYCFSINSFLLSETSCRNLWIFFHRDEIMSHIYTCSLRDWVHKVCPNPEDNTMAENRSKRNTGKGSFTDSEVRFYKSWVFLLPLFCLFFHIFKQGLWDLWLV